MSGAPGRCNDASVLRKSEMFRQLASADSRSKYHLIGDAAFPLKTWLMKPFPIRNNMPILESNYNYRLSSARMTIENSFGRLKGRWRILLKKPDVHVETMRKIIHCCFILHNYCEIKKQHVKQDWIDEVAVEEQFNGAADLVEEDHQEIEAEGHEVRIAKQKRIELARKLFNDNLSVVECA